MGAVSAERERFVYRAECTAGCGLPIGYHRAGSVEILHCHNNISLDTLLRHLCLSQNGAEDLFVTEREGLPDVIEDTMGHYKLVRVEKP